MTIVGRTIALLSPQERRQFAGVLATGIVAALIQIAGIGSVIPFVSLLLDPEMVQRNATFARVYAALGFGDVRSFLLFSGVMALAILLLGNAVTALSVAMAARFQWHTQHRLATRLLAYYLAQPYTVFLHRHSAEVTRNVLFETTSVVCGVLPPLAGLVVGGVTTALLAAFLFWLDPRVTLVAFAVLGSGYALVYGGVRRLLERAGAGRLEANHERLKVVAEAFADIKSLKVSGQEQAVLDRFQPAGAAVSRAAVLVQTLGPLPRYVIEVLAFGLLIGVLLALLYAGADMRRVLPLAAGFAFAGLRLVPALQGIYSALAMLRMDAAALKAIDVDYATQIAVASQPALPPLPITRELRIEGLSYAYPQAPARTLAEVSLAIPHPSFVAFVGHTGAGKTTLVDVILGLLEPQSGRVTVDDQPLTPGNRRAWQANIGYVPQEIVLADDSVAANIASGIPQARIDMAAVERAARIAGVHDFVAALPAGYATFVGERGVRLSGGQRQRIGLARALHRDPAVLILDEATSALDHETESAVRRALVAAAREKTVIVIAHRMSTVRDCDRIFVLESGRLVASGRYDELLHSSLAFRRLAADRAFADATGTASARAGLAPRPA